MGLTLSEAAHRVGRSKSALLRSIKAGRLSATRDELTGAWLIEPSELHRLYPPASEAVRDAPIDAPDTRRDAPELAELRARLADALDQVQDLRRQRDRAEDERRAVQARLDSLLVDQRGKSEPPAAVPARRPWWRWRR